MQEKPGDIKEEKKEISETEKIIRRRNNLHDTIKGFAVLILVLAVLFAGIRIWLVPGWEKSRYYDPTSNSPSFSKSAYCYTSLFAPDKKWYSLRVEDLGSGNYSFKVINKKPDFNSMSRVSTNDYWNAEDCYKNDYVTGKITKGELEMNGENVFAPRTSYPFYPYYAGVVNESRLLFPEKKTKSMEEMKKETESYIAQVNDAGVYNVYVTFDKVYPWTEAATFLDDATKKDGESSFEMMYLWLAVCQKMGSEDVYEASTTMGVNIYNAVYDYKERNYNLSQEYDFDLSERIKTVADSEDFMKMMGCSEINSFYRISDTKELFGENEPQGNSSVTKSPLSGMHKTFEDITYLSTPHDIDARYKCEKKYLTRFAENIKKNGIYTYGCYYELVRGDTIKALAKDSHVSYIYVEQIG